MDAEKVDFDTGERVVSNANCHWDSRDKGAEFAFLVVSCSETYVPHLFVVGCQ